jgi:hypothetical protein
MVFGTSSRGHDLLADHVGDGDGLPGRFGHGDDAEYDQRHRGDHIEVRQAVWKELRQAHDRARRNALEAHAPGQGGDDGTDQQSEQYRKLAGYPREQARKHQGEADRGERQHDVDGRGEIRRAGRSGDDGAVHLDQVDGDQQQHGADDEFGKVDHAAREHRQECQIEECREYDRAGRGPNIGLLGDGEEDHDRRSAGNHDEGQPGAELEGAEALQQRSEPAHQKRGADQIYGEAGGEIEGLADQEHGRDRRRRHYQHMLQPEQKEPLRRQYLVNRIDVRDGGGHLRGPSPHPLRQSKKRTA